MPAADPNALLHGVSVTTLYYIFSTIPQTLAGAFAFLGAFVLFRVQTQNRAIDDACKELYTGDGQGSLLIEEARIAFTYGDGVKFLSAVENMSIADIYNIEGNPYHILPDLWVMYKQSLKHNLNTKKQLFKHFKWSLILTSFSVLVPIFLLLFAEKLSHNTPMAYLSTLVVICLAVVCFGTYIWIIIRALADK